MPKNFSASFFILGWLGYDYQIVHCANMSYVKQSNGTILYFVHLLADRNVKFVIIK